MTAQRTVFACARQCAPLPAPHMERGPAEDRRLPLQHDYANHWLNWLACSGAARQHGSELCECFSPSLSALIDNQP